MFDINFSLSFVSSAFFDSLASSMVENIRSHVLAAANFWGRYLQASANADITISVAFEEFDGDTLAQGGTDFFDVGRTSDGRTVFDPLPMLKIDGHGDLNGAAPDIEITIDISSLQDGTFFFDHDGVFFEDEPIGGGEIDFFTVALHEIGHGLGIVSFFDSAADAGNTDISALDQFIRFQGGSAVFDGPAARSVNGGLPVGLAAADDTSHLAGFLDDLMGSALADGERLLPSAFDLAILDDIGFTLKAPTAGDDELFGIARFDEVVDLLGGDDIFRGLSGHDIVRGGAGNDFIEGGGGDDILIGGTGADTLIGGDGSDTASFEDAAAGVHASLADNSQATGEARGDVFLQIDNLTGSAFDDVLEGDFRSNRLVGGAGNDRLNGNGGSDVLEGNGGDDLIESGVHGSVIDGGEGQDTASFALSGVGVEVDLQAGSARRDNHLQRDVLLNIENVVGSASADRLTGDAGANMLAGGSGDDMLTGGAGADTLDGGEGMDTAAFAASSAGVRVQLWNGLAQGGDADGDTILNIENLLGSAFSDRLEGDAGDNLLRGGAGGDRLNGGGGSDTASFAGSSAGVRVQLWNGLAQGGDADGDTILNIENLIGSDFADRLEGDAGDNLLTGGAGADILNGGGGSDTASFAGSSAGVRVQLWNGLAQGGDAEGDMISNIESLVGSAFADRLEGSAGTNRLDGGAGDDMLVGGAGADVLDGGEGTDTASFASSNAGVTVLLDQGIAKGGHAEGDILSNIENLVGSNFADVLGGDGKSNIIEGGKGDDLILVTGSESFTSGTFDGGEGNDTISFVGRTIGVHASLSGDTGRFRNVENAIGSAFNDHLTGDSGVNRLEGADGDDFLRGGEGADILIGGDGIDTAIFENSAAGVTIRLDTGTGTGGDAQGDILKGVENLIGSSSADTLSGDATANRLTGGGGNDRLFGLSGDDVLEGGGHDDMLEGGDGDDILDGESGLDILMGGAGNDLLIGGAEADELDGGEGNDTASFANISNIGTGVRVQLWNGLAQGGDAEGDTLTNIENLVGSDFDDWLEGDGGANMLAGGGGHDRLAGGGGDDTLAGGSGDDLLIGGRGADILDGGDGDDTASFASSSTGVRVQLWNGLAQVGDAEGDRILNIEHLVGSAFDDRLEGDAGANMLEGGAGADLLDGRGGDDTASFAGSSASVRVQLWNGLAQGGDAEGDTLISMENLVGSAFADRLEGDFRNNVLEGGAGGDILNGGNGSDTASYASSNAGVRVQLWSGLAQGGDAEGDMLVSIENLTGSAFDDRLEGDAGDNVLDGGDGHDVLNGGGGSDTASFASSSSSVTASLADGSARSAAGNDVLTSFENLIGSDFNDFLLGDAGANRIDGGSGDDTLVGLGGADVLDGGEGSDTLNFIASAAGVRVQLWNGLAQGGDAEGDMIANIENLAGSDFDDRLEGDAGNNVLHGHRGNDRLAGGLGDDRLLGDDGDDRLAGGAGADLLDGGHGFDTASFASSSAGVRVQLWNGLAHGGDAEGDTLRSIENLTGSAFADRLEGDAHGNRLEGGAGDDLLSGGGGGDRLAGGAGDDMLSGGTGADVFVFGDDFGNDRVADFEDGVDLLDFTGTGLAFADLAISQVGADTLIEDGRGNSVTLAGMAAAGITADDFLFAGGQAVQAQSAGLSIAAAPEQVSPAGGVFGGALAPLLAEFDMPALFGDARGLVEIGPWVRFADEWHIL